MEKLPIVDDDFNLKGLITIKDIEKQIKYPNAAKDDQGRLLCGAGVGITGNMMERVDIIIGGAGTSATYGNRIISVTGGTVNYSVFGGSNGSDGDEGDGTLNGTPYVYIGGNATIGDEDLVENNNKLFGAEAGSVFGIGNGKTGNWTRMAALYI